MPLSGAVLRPTIDQTLLYKRASTELFSRRGYNTILFGFCQWRGMVNCPYNFVLSSVQFEMIYLSFCQMCYLKGFLYDYGKIEIWDMTLH